MTYTSKAKLLVSLVKTQKYLETLTLLVAEAVYPQFSHLAIWTSPFQIYFDLDLKSKVFSLTSDLNPFSIGSLTPIEANLLMALTYFRLKLNEVN